MIFMTLMTSYDILWHLMTSYDILWHMKGAGCDSSETLLVACWYAEVTIFDDLRAWLHSGTVPRQDRLSRAIEDCPGYSHPQAASPGLRSARQRHWATLRRHFLRGISTHVLPMFYAFLHISLEFLQNFFIFHALLHPFSSFSSFFRISKRMSKAWRLGQDLFRQIPWIENPPQIWWPHNGPVMTSRLYSIFPWFPCPKMSQNVPNKQILSK